MINDKQFNTTVKAIKTNAEGLAQLIHDAGLFAIAQANEHGNTGFAVRLIEAMGKKHDAQRVVNWLIAFGKIGVKAGAIVYRNRKDITPEALPSWIEKANTTPYWVLTKQKELVESYDYLAMLHSIVKKHESVEKKQAEGKQVTELHPEVLEEVRNLIKKLSVPAEVVQDDTIISI